MRVSPDRVIDVRWFFTDCTDYIPNPSPFRSCNNNFTGKNPALGEELIKIRRFDKGVKPPNSKCGDLLGTPENWLYGERPGDTYQLVPGGAYNEPKLKIFASGESAIITDDGLHYPQASVGVIGQQEELSYHTATASTSASAESISLTAEMPTALMGVACTVAPHDGIGFEGVDEEVLIGDGFQLGSEFTVVCWIRSIADGTIIFHDNGHSSFSSGWHIHLSSGQLRYIMQHPSESDINVYSESTITTGEWTHIAIVHVDGEYHIYINGELDASQEERDPVYDGTEPLRGLVLGRYHDGAGNIAVPWAGVIDELAIFSEDKSAKIADWYNGGVGSCISDEETGLLGLYHCDEDDYYTLTDYSGEDRHGDLMNGAHYTIGKLTCI